MSEEKDKPLIESYPEQDLNEMVGFKKELEMQVKEIEKLFGSLDELEQKYLGKDIIETISKVSQIAQLLLSRDSRKLNGEVIYNFENFNIKELLDIQFRLAGYHGYLSTYMGRLKATALVKKSFLEITSTYVYETVYDHIRDSKERRPTIPEIEAVIKTRMKEPYAFQRIAAALSVLLETVVKSVEFIRNILNSIVTYMKEDTLNSLHLEKSRV